MSDFVDLSQVVPSQAGRTAPEGAGEGAQSFVRELTEQQLESAVELSKQVAVVVYFWSPRAPETRQYGDDLAALINRLQGKLVLALVDADQNPGLAQAFQLQGLPQLVGLLNGQVMPLFNGIQPITQVEQFFDQLISVAAEQGLHGLPTSDEAVEPEPEPLDENHQAAFDAISVGDYAAAIAAYEKALANNPKDVEAEAGLAQVGLLKRLGTQNPQDIRQRAAEHPNDIDAQLNVADLDVAGGHIDDAFVRLLDLFGQTFGKEREPIRLRLLDYFAIIGAEDPRVAQARQRLATLLY